MTSEVIKPISVFDYSTFFCSGIRELLKSRGFEVNTYLELSAIVAEIEQEKRPQLAILGPDIAEHLQFSLCRSTVKNRLDVHFIIMSPASDDDLFQVDALQAGANACISNTVNEEALLETVDAVSCGHVLFPRSVFARALDGHPKLTDREMEILVLMACNRTDREIANRLTLSIPTVRNHSQHVLEKYEVHHRHEAIRRAKRLGWTAN